MSTETWCVYQPEWVRVYASRKPGPAGRGECAERAAEVRARVRDDEWRLYPQGLGRMTRTWYLELLLPTLKGEWKDRQDAERQRDRLGPGAVVVAWGSEEEQRLLDYGGESLAR